MTFPRFRGRGWLLEEPLARTMAAPEKIALRSSTFAPQELSVK